MLSADPALLYTRFEDAVTLLHLAVEFARKDLVLHLCRHHPDLIFTGDRLGGTPLHNVGRARYVEESFRGHHTFELAEILIEHGASLERRDNRGETPLISLLCLANDYPGWIDTARLMLDSGADPNARDKEGNTFIHHLVSPGDRWSPVELLQVALDFGARLDIRNQEGETAPEVSSRTDYHGCKPERLEQFLELLMC